MENPISALRGQMAIVVVLLIVNSQYGWAINPKQWQAAAMAALWLGAGASLAPGWAYVVEVIKARKKRKEWGPPRPFRLAD